MATGDRHEKNPITYRPLKKDEPWLEEYARLHGMSERSILHQALAAFRMTKEGQQGWDPAQLIELMRLFLVILDIPFGVTMDPKEVSKRERVLQDRVTQVTSVLKWLTGQVEGKSVGYMIEYVRENMPGPDSITYHTDHAEWIAESQGKTIEEARQWLADIGLEKSATDAIRTEIEK